MNGHSNQYGNYLNLDLTSKIRKVKAMAALARDMRLADEPLLDAIIEDLDEILLHE